MVGELILVYSINPLVCGVFLSLKNGKSFIFPLEFFYFLNNVLMFASNKQSA